MNSNSLNGNASLHTRTPNNVLGMRSMREMGGLSADHAPVRRDPQAAAAALAVFDDIEQAVFVIDQSMSIRYQNAAGIDLMVRGAGIELQSGRLCCPDPKDQEALMALVSNMPWRNPAIGQTQVLRMSQKSRHDGLLLSVRVLSVPHPDGYGPVQLGLITVLDREKRAKGPSLLQLKQAFGLTRAEAAVAIHIANGDTPAEIAEFRSVSVETIRAQLRVLYSKTGTNRQAELVRLIQQLAAFG